MKGKKEGNPANIGRKRLARVTMKIDPEAYHKLKLLATLRRVRLQEVCDDMLETYLAAQSNEIKEGLEDIYAQVF